MLKQALNLDAKAGGTPEAAKNAAAMPPSAESGGPGTDQSAAGMSNTGGMQSGASSGINNSGTSGTNNSGTMGTSTGQEARTGGVATPVGPGTDQSSAGISNTDNMQTGGIGDTNNRGMMGSSTGQSVESRTGGVASPVGPGTDQSSAGTSNTSNMQTGGELREGSTVGAPTGQTGELRTGGSTTGGSMGQYQTRGSIADTGIPHSTDLPLPVRVCAMHARKSAAVSC